MGGKIKKRAHIVAFTASGIKIWSRKLSKRREKERKNKRENPHQFAEKELQQGRQIAAQLYRTARQSSAVCSTFGENSYREANIHFSAVKLLYVEIFLRKVHHQFITHCPSPFSSSLSVCLFGLPACCFFFSSVCRCSRKIMQRFD